MRDASHEFAKRPILYPELEEGCSANHRASPDHAAALRAARSEARTVLAFSKQKLDINNSGCLSRVCPFLDIEY